MTEFKKHIFNTAHSWESNALAREYFDKCELKVNKVTLEQVEKLSDFISKEIYPLLLDESYSMIKKLSMDRKIKKNKNGSIFLYVNGDYFTKRNAIYFSPQYNTISFCAWASGCNRIPFIKGFVEWCDWLRKELKS